MIVDHLGLVPERVWFEPSFVAEVGSTSDAFRSGLRAWVHTEIEKPGVSEPFRLRLVNLLAVLRNKFVSQHLRRELERGRWLTETECRALIFLDTEDAIGVYADFVNIANATPLSRYAGDTEEEKQKARGYALDALVLLGVDVGWYPHKWLIELVDAALGSRDDEHVFFGFRWAEGLHDASLLRPYMERKAPSFSRGTYLDFGPRLIAELLKHSDFATAQRLYDQHDEDVREAIVQHLYEVPGPEF